MSGIKKIDPSQIRYTPEEGEVIQNLKGEYLVWKDNGWMKITSENSGLNMGLYDINKQIVSQLPALTDFTKVGEDIQALHDKYQNQYYMMYGKEISYFTLFEICNADSFDTDVIDCCKNVGVIKAMDITEAKDAIEIWIHPESGEPTCLYLFPYDNGVVRVGE